MALSLFPDMPEMAVQNAIFQLAAVLGQQRAMEISREIPHASTTPAARRLFILTALFPSCSHPSVRR